MKTVRILFAAALTLLAAAVPTASPQAPLTIDTLHRFSAPLRAGRAPLAEAPDGTVFGIMESGGVEDMGAIFQLVPNGSGGFVFSLLHVFSGADGHRPAGVTYSAVDDMLYGTTMWGGVNGPMQDGMGTVFKLSRSGALTTLIDFNMDFSNPQPLSPQTGLLEASDGLFYGTASGASASPGSGALFRMDRTGNYDVLHIFSGTDGASPGATLVEGSDGFLYGTTERGGAANEGTVFRIGKNGVGFQSLHSFTGSDGAVPQGLTLDASGAGDVFYGLTVIGGTTNRGSVFRFSPSGPVTSVVSFGPDPDGIAPVGGLVKANDGRFYGTTEAGMPGFLGGVFSFDPASGNLGLVHDFNSNPGIGLMTSAGLLRASDGTLLGTAVSGGTHRVGTVFRVDLSTPEPDVTKVVDFPPLGPAQPSDRMVRASDGHLYGTTPGGGTFSSGTIFRLANGVMTTLHDFDFVDGHLPSGELVQGSDGFLYGTTTYGGNIQFPGDIGGGIIFKISLSGVFSVVHRFTNYSSEGAHPLAGLVEGPDGNFYGTTHQNGPGGAGTVFKVTPSGVLTTLHGFDVWSATRGTLVLGEDGYFYGVTREGGSTPTGGTIYKIDSQGNFVLLHEFVNVADGAHPAGLTLGSDGNLYGVTEHGGTFYGTLFRITSGGALTVLHRFEQTIDGEAPTAAPVEGGDGNFYGTTWLSGRLGVFFTGLGTLYRYDSGGFSLLHTFGSTTGVAQGSPFAGLVQGTDNRLFGGNLSGGGGSLYAFSAGIANKAPVARSQRISIEPNIAVPINVVGSDPDGDAIAFVVVDQPDHGTLSGSGPSFLYQPNPGFTGTDAFHVRVNDGTVSSAVAGVIITVRAPDATPTADGRNVTTTEDTPLAITLTGSDPEGSPLTFTVLTTPSSGTLSGTAPNLTYTPAADVHGTDSFTFKVNDGIGDSSPAIISITIDPSNDAPTANGQTIVITNDVPVSIALTGADVDGDALTYAIVTPPVHGTLSGTAPNLTYTAQSGYVGADGFTFQVNDGALSSAVATVSITVNAANRAPVAQNQSVAVRHNTPKSIVLGATDPDGDALTYINETLPLHGVLSGTAPNYTYTPHASYSGPDTFTFKVNDGARDSNVATVSVTVGPSEQAPIANPGGPYVTDLGAPVTFDGSASSDPDEPFGDTIVQYQWFASHQLLALGENPTIPASTVTTLIGVGIHTITLRVTDSRGFAHTETTNLTVRAPVALFTVAPNPAGCSQLVTFDASASATARNGRTIVSAVYSFDDGTPDASGIVTTHAFARYRNYSVRLTVTDDLGFSANASQATTIYPGLPAAQPGGPYATDTSTGITFDGRASNPNQASCGDSITTYQWLINGTMSLSAATPSLTAAQVASLGAGTFPVQLTVVDFLGAAATASTTLTIQPATIATTTTLQVSPTTAGALQAITLTATVAPVFGGGVPTGAVEFVLNGTTTFGVAPLQAGVAVLNTNAGVSAGSHSVTARYLGTLPYTGSVSAAETLSIRPVAESTYTILIPWTNPQALGTPVTVSAIVVPLGGGAGATGAVDFFEGTSLVGSVALSGGGIATLSWTPSAPGTLRVSARYQGSAALAASSSQPALITVFTGATPASTTTSLAAAPSPVTFGQPVTFTATVSAPAPVGGQVTFFADGAVLGTAAVTNVGGVMRATLTTAALPIGPRIVSASYNGTPGFAASNAAPMAVIINP